MCWTFLLKILTNPMDLKLKMDRLLAILGVYLFFLCGLFWLCVVPWVIFYVWGGEGVGLFGDKYLY